LFGIPFCMSSSENDIKMFYQQFHPIHIQIFLLIQNSSYKIIIKSKME
jgi:hypothetical protein